MKIIIQRVNQASVSIEDDVVGSIEKGLVLLVGIAPEDTTEDIAYAVRKITSMRIFSDDEGKMNLSIQDIKGSVLSISQFTLFADTKKEIVQLLLGQLILLKRISFMISLIKN